MRNERERQQLEAAVRDELSKGRGFFYQDTLQQRVTDEGREYEMPSNLYRDIPVTLAGIGSVSYVDLGPVIVGEEGAKRILRTSAGRSVHTLLLYSPDTANLVSKKITPHGDESITSASEATRTKFNELGVLLYGVSPTGIAYGLEPLPPTNMTGATNRSVIT